MARPTTEPKAAAAVRPRAGARVCVGSVKTVNPLRRGREVPPWSFTPPDDASRCHRFGDGSRRARMFRPSVVVLSLSNVAPMCWIRKLMPQRSMAGTPAGWARADQSQGFSIEYEYLPPLVTGRDSEPCAATTIPAAAQFHPQCCPGHARRFAAVGATQARRAAEPAGLRPRFHDRSPGDAHAPFHPTDHP